MSRLVFFGNERLATGVTTNTPVLQSLIDDGHEIVALVVAQNEVGASRKGRTVEIVDTAQEHNIPVLSPAKPANILDELKNYEADAGVLVAYGKILPEEIINLFPAGIINLHPSLLPKHRGPTPIEHAILNGEPETGVSIMKLSKDMDSGPVYIQETVSLVGDETKQELVDQLGSQGADLLVEHLSAILDGSLSPTEQDSQNASYDDKLSKDNSQLDFGKPAAQLVREVRAYLGWPRSRTSINSIDVIVTAAHVGEASGEIGRLYMENRELGIYTTDGTFIIDSLIPAGKQEMTAQAFLAGYQINS